MLSINKFNPAYNWLKIELIENENKVNLITTVNKDLYSIAKILGVGPTAGERNDKVFHTFSLGDHIVIHKGKISEVFVNGEKVLMIPDDGVILLDQSN